MIIIMNTKAADEQVNAVEEKLAEMGLSSNVSRGIQRIVIGAIGDEQAVDQEALEALHGVEKVVRVMKPYKIVARESHEASTIVDVAGIPIGGNTVQVIAGPCSVETPSQMAAAAEGVAAAGCRLMRGGAFKPRTSPYSFQGVGEDGLSMFRDAASVHNLPIVTELMDVRMLDTFLENKIDVIQIGTRNMQNFDLLKEVGRTQVPVILKRGMCATISEWLMSAEVNVVFVHLKLRTVICLMSLQFQY